MTPRPIDGRIHTDKGESMTDAKKPAHTIRHGRLQAAIWRNQNDQGVYFNVTFQRSYKNGSGEWHTTESFGREDLLLQAKMANEAHTEILRLEKAERGEQPAKPQTREVVAASGGRRGR
jgi:hypothetical protein